MPNQSRALTLLVVVATHAVPLLGAYAGLPESAGVSIGHLGRLLKLVQGVRAVLEPELAVAASVLVVLRVGGLERGRHLVVGQGGLGGGAGGGDGGCLGGGGRGRAGAVLVAA